MFVAVTKEKLEEIFSAHGKITSSAIMTNEKGESKGFGFINYETAESAQAASDLLNGTTIGGKQIYVGRAQKRQERDEVLRHQRAEQLQKYQGANVYVKNLDDNVNDEKLNQEFSRFGPIISARVMTDEKGNSKGFGFVSFSNAEDASRAINEMNGVIFGTKPLYASLAQRKDVRRSQLAALHQQKLSMIPMNIGVPVNIRGPAVMYPGNAPPIYYPNLGVPPRAIGNPAYLGQISPPRRFPAPPPVQNGSPAANGQPQPSQTGNNPANVRGGGPAQVFGGPGGLTSNIGNGQANNVNGGQGLGFQARQANGRRNPRPPPIPQQQQLQPNGRGRPQNAQGQVNRSYKYTATARNQPPAFVNPGYPPYPQPPVDAELDNEASKQMLGEHLYAQIHKVQPALAGKITGMLIESLDPRELSALVQTPILLDAKVNEALAVLAAPDAGVADAQVIA